MAAAYVWAKGMQEISFAVPDSPQRFGSSCKCFVRPGIAFDNADRTYSSIVKQAETPSILPKLPGWNRKFLCSALWLCRFSTGESLIQGRRSRGMRPKAGRIDLESLDFG